MKFLIIDDHPMLRQGVAAVPEPGTYAMFTAALRLVGLMVRRRRTAAPA